MSTPPDAAVWMYVEGRLSCKAIAPMFGVSESTVKRWMRSAGVMRTANQGRPLSDECKAGHDLSEWRRRDKSGNAYCLLCNRERGKRTYLRKKKRMASKKTPKKTPAPPEQSPGKTGRFGKPPPLRPGACPTCGALPACTPPKH